MVTRLPHDTPCMRNWTGNNQRAGRDFFGRIRLTDSPLTLRLQWRANNNATPQLVGAYSLDLKALLKKDYIRAPEGYPGEVVLRFQHTDDGSIQIARNRNSPAIDVGRFD